MAAASLLALIDDIATLLDDISVMTKRAAAKTSGVLGDDLALNAQQVTGVAPSRSRGFGPIANCRWSGPWPRARCSTRPFSCRRHWPSALWRPGR